MMNGSFLITAGRFFNSWMIEVDLDKKTLEPSSRTTLLGLRRNIEKIEPQIMRMNRAMYVPSLTVPDVLPCQLSAVGMIEPMTAPIDQMAQKMAMYLP